MTALFKTHETSYGQSGSKAIRFSFKWESVTGGASECGNELKGNHGTVTSPGYPTNYPTNAQCTWSISLGVDAKETDHIVLSFKVKTNPDRNHTVPDRLGSTAHEILKIIESRLP